VTGTVESRRDSRIGRGNPDLSPGVRVARVVASYVLIGIGVGLMLRAEFGVSPYDVLTTGLADTLDVPFAVAFVLVSATFYGVGMLLGGRTGWASLVGTAVIGPLIQLSLATIPETERIVARVPMFTAGLLVLAFAVCLVISTELGPGPGEVFMLGIIARGVPVAAARWLTDGFAFVLGAALGGAVGIGTVVFAVAFGPLVAKGLRLLRYRPPVNAVEVVVAP
jgi:uncharacterized membrane protein YczE